MGDFPDTFEVEIKRASLAKGVESRVRLMPDRSYDLLKCVH